MKCNSVCFFINKNINVSSYLKPKHSGFLKIFLKYMRDGLCHLKYNHVFEIFSHR